jgi:hypothetical protein
VEEAVEQEEVPEASEVRQKHDVESFFFHSTIGQLEHGVHLAKGRWWPHHGDEGGLLLEAIAEAGEEDMDQLAIGNRVPKFAELIGCSFDPLTVDGERGFS